jgi:3-oxoadipate enol-lactonase
LFAAAAPCQAQSAATSSKSEAIIGAPSQLAAIMAAQSSDVAAMLVSNARATFAVHPDGTAIYDRSVAASATMSMAALAAARAPLLLGSAATPAMREEVIATMGRIDPAAYRQGAKAVWLADQRDAVAAIDVPTLVVVGDEDSITPPALSRALADLAGTAASPRPLVDYAVIAQTGHLANLEQAAAFNRIVAQFLAKTEAN